MDTKNRLRAERGAGPGDDERVVRQLRAAATDRSQSEERREWIRAATRC